MIALLAVPTSARWTILRAPGRLPGLTSLAVDAVTTRRSAGAGGSSPSPRWPKRKTVELERRVETGATLISPSGLLKRNAPE